MDQSQQPGQTNDPTISLRIPAWMGSMLETLEKKLGMDQSLLIRYLIQKRFEEEFGEHEAHRLIKEASDGLRAARDGGQDPGPVN